MPSVTEFLKDKRTDSTRTAYFSGLCSFVECIYGLPEKTGLRRTKEHRQKCIEKIDQYMTEDRNYGDDLTSLIKYLEKRNASPQQINIAITAVKEFLFFNKKKLDEFDLKRVTKNKPVVSVDSSRDYDIDHEVLRKLFNHCNLTLKTIILMLISSGARINEIMSLKVSDIEIKDQYGILYFRRENTKTKKGRYTLISKECVEVLKEYLQKEKPDTLLFDFTYENALYMLNLAAKNAGLNGEKKKIHFHLFRKFFMSQLKLAISSEVVELLAGHEGYLSSSYRRYSKEQVIAEYLKGEHLITIQIPSDIRTIREEVKKEIDDNTKLVRSLVLKNQELEDRVMTLEMKLKIYGDIFAAAKTEEAKKSK
jgi:integrase